MELIFVSRTEYSKKNESGYIQRLRYIYPGAYILPESGDNKLSQKCCEKILKT